MKGKNSFKLKKYLSIFYLLFMCLCTVFHCFGMTHFGMTHFAITSINISMFILGITGVFSINGFIMGLFGCAVYSSSIGTIFILISFIALILSAILMFKKKKAAIYPIIVLVVDMIFNFFLFNIFAIISNVIGIVLLILYLKADNEQIEITETSENNLNLEDNL